MEVKTAVNNRQRRWDQCVQRHVNDIRRDGVSAVHRKILALLKKIMVSPLILLAVPFVLLVRLLRPFILIRFGSLRSDRLGHFAGNTELYLCKRDVYEKGKHILDLFYHGEKPICNYQLKKMWERILYISPVVRWLAKANSLIPGGVEHKISVSTDRDKEGLFARVPAHLSFTLKEEEKGSEALQKSGIPSGKEFICFYTRDTAYLNAMFPERNWNYHNYRNADIRNYIPAVQELVRRDYFAVRMGAYVKEPLSVEHPMIIDYAANGRTDFLDIYMAGTCKFFLTSTGGLNAIPGILRRPVAFADLVPLMYLPATPQNGDLFIPKKLWLREERRFLTFREILDSSLGGLSFGEEYEKLGIEVIDNSPEEIMDLVVEMDQRLKGEWQTTKGDEELQQRFRECVKPGKFNNKLVSRMGTEFLRQNQELLR